MELLNGPSCFLHKHTVHAATPHTECFCLICHNTFVLRFELLYISHVGEKLLLLLLLNCSRGVLGDAVFVGDVGALVS